MQQKDLRCKDCYVCVRRKMTCPLHDIAAREAVSKYFNGPITEEDEKKMRTWEDRKCYANLPTWEIIIARQFVHFADNFSDPEHEDREKKRLEHGQMDISFKVEHLLDLPNGYDFSAGEVCFIMKANKYFPLGCVYKGGINWHFYVLFEDGKFFVSDRKDDPHYMESMQLIIESIKYYTPIVNGENN